MWLTLKRIIKAGFINFWRNGSISLSSVVVITNTLMVIISLIFINALLTATLDQLRNKVDINVYFTIATPETSILEAQKTIEGRENVERVVYISRDEALANFRERHRDDETALQALDELGENPLRASLSVKATDPTLYQEIASFIETEITGTDSAGAPIVDEINFYQNRAAIESLASIIQTTDRVGLIATLALVASAILIVYTTMRLAIFSSRDEIAVMRLVGASYAYIRGPFVFEGMMYGFIAGIITLLLTYPILYWLGPKTEAFTGSINLFTYYLQNFGSIFITIIGAGILLGAVSSFLAVKKYLKI